MRYAIALTAAILATVLLVTGCQKREPPAQPAAPTPAPPASSSEVTPPQEEPEGTEGEHVSWELTSPAFEDGQPIPAAHTADGKDTSPALDWTDPPDGTAQLALICDDPDAPGRTWVHWVLYGIPPTIRDLPEGLPADETLDDLDGARQGTNDSGKTGYGGPAPPRGKVHHYHFKLYALDTELDPEPDATKAELEKAMEGHILAQAELVGTYER